METVSNGRSRKAGARPGGFVHASTVAAVTGQSRQFQARALAAMYAAGGTLGLLAVAVPHGTGVNTAAWALNSSLGFPVGAALFFVGRKVPTWLLHGLLVTGAAMVALGVLFGDGGPASVATSFFFVWVALYVSWFFSPRATVVHLAIDSALFAFVLKVDGGSAGPAVWLLVMGTAIVIAIVVALMHRELIRVATLDALTGLPTRHTLSDALTREVARAERGGSPLCLAIIDVDGLKAINDLQGHQIGDEVLVAAARAWRTALRDSDVLVRFGGDEFVAVLPDCSPDVAGRLQQRIQLPASISCSAGLAWWRPGETATELLRRADIELYEAKRDRHESSSPAARPGDTILDARSLSITSATATPSSNEGLSRSAERTAASTSFSQGSSAGSCGSPGGGS